MQFSTWHSGALLGQPLRLVASKTGLVTRELEVIYMIEILLLFNFKYEKDFSTMNPFDYLVIKSL